MFGKRSKPKFDERQFALESIRGFIDSTADDWAWDDFISPPMKDPEVARIQGLCLQLPDEYPPRHKKEYCNPEGIERLKELLAELEQKRVRAAGDNETDALSSGD